MQYPDVKVGRAVIQVVFDAALQRTGHMGEARVDRRVIALAPDMKKQVLAETLLHEIIHLVSDRCGAKLSEKQTLRLEIGLSDFIAQNLPLIQRLSKELQ